VDEHTSQRLEESQGANLVAVIDVAEDLARRESEKNGVKYYTDFGRALDDPEVDAVSLPVPTPFHISWHSML